MCLLFCPKYLTFTVTDSLADPENTPSLGPCNSFLHCCKGYHKPSSLKQYKCVNLLALEVRNPKRVSLGQTKVSAGPAAPVVTRGASIPLPFQLLEALCIPRLLAIR